MRLQMGKSLIFLSAVRLFVTKGKHTLRSARLLTVLRKGLLKEQLNRQKEKNWIPVVVLPPATAVTSANHLSHSPEPTFVLAPQPRPL